MVHNLVGGAQPMWLRAVMVREGDDVVTRCCIVTDGQFFPVEVRVNVPQLIAQARALGIDKANHDQVGGFGSWLKKAVKTVTKSKIVKAVGSVVKKVANSPVAWVANPGMVLGAHTTAKAATGKGLVKGKLGAAIDLGTKAVQVAVPAASAPAALGFVSSRAAAALGVGMRAMQVAKTGPLIANAARLAQQKVALGKAAATALQAKKVLPAKALPLVRQALATRASVAKLAPALAKQAVQSAKVRTAFGNIALQAKGGSADALLASNVLAKSAQVLSTIQKLEQASAGGVPGLLITASGRIVRSPRGRFLQSAAKTAQQGTLYRGPKTPTLRGAFTVAGWESVGATSSWGGSDDPGNELDGPFLPATVPGGGYQLDDFSGVGALTP